MYEDLCGEAQSPMRRDRVPVPRRLLPHIGLEVFTGLVYCPFQFAVRRYLVLDCL